MLERAYREDIERPAMMDEGYAVAAPQVAQPVAQPATASPYSVFGNTGLTYGQGANGQYYFDGDPISALDYQSLAGRGDQQFNVPAPTVASGVVQPAGGIPRATVESGTVAPAGGGIPGKTGMVVDPYRPETANASPVVNGLAPTDPNFTVPTAANPDFGMYGGSAGQYHPPQLQPASGKFSTPYYAAYTNDGDLAGAVMVGQGQGVRLVDAKTGEVVFQGSGPEAAQQAVGIANAVSDTKGRKAAWAIQADYGGDKGWVSQAAERYDPKKSGFFGTLADIALPVLGALLMPVTGGLSAALAAGLGAAGGSVISSVAQGRSLGNTLLRAGLSGVGAGVVGPALNTALAPLTQAGTSAATNAATQGALQAGGNAATQAVTQAGTNAAASGAGNLISEFVVNGIRTAIPTALAQGLGAGAGSLASGALTSGGGGGGTQPATTTNVPPPTDLDPVVVQAVQRGLTVQEMVGLGIPLATINATMAAMGGGTPVNEFTVQGNNAPPPKLAEAVGAGVTDLEPLTVTAPAKPEVPQLLEHNVPTAVGAVAGTLAGALASGDPNQVKNWIKDHPVEAAGLGLTVGSALLGGAGGSGSYGIPGGGGSGAPGTRGSLSPLYSAGLPPPTMGARTPQVVNVDQRYAIEHPEGSFFSNVPKAVGPANFAVPSPREALLQGVPDLDGDGTVTDADLLLWRQRFGGRGFKVGGRVQGAGHGRSDSIDARLSDGEYVVDAETVALLGNGSSKAGAKALDDFRVKVRKDKGRDLAKGRISRDARDPHSYMGAH